jgi:hypothetical protein
MPTFVEAERGYINLDLVAFVFRKEDGAGVCYSAEGNEIGTLSRRIVEQLVPKPAAAPKRHLRPEHVALAHAEPEPKRWRPPWVDAKLAQK